MQVRVQAADMRGSGGRPGRTEASLSSGASRVYLQVTQTDGAGIDDIVTKAQSTVTCPQDM